MSLVCDLDPSILPNGWSSDVSMDRWKGPTPDGIETRCSMCSRGLYVLTPPSEYQTCDPSRRGDVHSSEKKTSPPSRLEIFLSDDLTLLKTEMLPLVSPV